MILFLLTGLNWISRTPLRQAGGELAFKYETPGTWQHLVDGFTTDQEIPAVYDVTNPAAVVQIEGVTMVASPTGTGYAAQFKDTTTAATKYWAATATALAQHPVQEIEDVDTPSNLRSTANHADHIIIYHKAFETQAQQLRDFQGIKSAFYECGCPGYLR